jgi:hypothetical protein
MKITEGKKLDFSYRYCAEKLFPSICYNFRIVTGFPVFSFPLVHNIGGLTIGKTIFIFGNNFNNSYYSLSLLMHELVHVKQYKDYGLCHYLWHYVGYYVKLLLTNKKTYRTIPYEEEAYDFQNKFEKLIRKYSSNLNTEIDASFENWIKKADLSSLTLK